MTWIVLLSIILVSALKILVTCLPTPVVKWLMTKFQLHPTLDDQSVTVTVDGKHLEGKNKMQVIDLASYSAGSRKIDLVSKLGIGVEFKDCNYPRGSRISIIQCFRMLSTKDALVALSLLFAAVF